MSPLISVLILFHKDQPYLRDAVASVLQQTLTDWELILVDNGVGLPESALNPAADPRVRWLRFERNQGIPAAHNAAVAAAQGEFVALLDYDDLALPRRLEVQVDALARHPSWELVSSRAERIDCAGRVVGREFSLLKSDDQRAYSAYAAPVVTPAYAGRRAVFARHPYRPEFPYAADFDFLSRVGDRGALHGVPEVLLRYRWYPGQTTDLFRDEIERSFCAIRLLTARRRAGRPENIDTAVGLADPGVPRSHTCLCYAQVALAENLHILAAYQARRMFVVDRRASVLAASLQLALRIARRSPHNVRQSALRMFLRGPVKALGCQPA